AEDAQNDNTSEVLAAKLSRNPCPSHWTLLYSSDEHGTGANRFLHHIIGYKGPTILFIKGDSGNNEYVTYCVCSTMEWRESHLYWGDDDSMIIELQPSYKIIEHDPRNPFVNIDQSFNSVSFGDAPHRIMSIEAWGCGDRKSREKQIEIKKWQVKEAEKQRVVKLSPADWLDHPDRYLLELAGKPSYNNGNS
ncbi:hypothetical protein PV325_012531, partial [Microctonus aethiopoides]